MGYDLLAAKLKAEAEWSALKKIRRTRFFPTVDANSKHYRALNCPDGTPAIKFGPVQSRGENLPGGRNYADYIDSKGGFDVLSFYCDHQATFPLFWVLVQRHVSIVSNEAGAERAFNHSGIIAHPTRSNIGVTTYQNAVIRKANINTVRVPEEYVAEEFMRRKKEGWSKEKEAEIAAVIANEEAIESGEYL